MKRARHIFGRAFFQDNIDRLRFRRPDTEVGFVCSNDFRADRITTLHWIRPVFPAPAGNLCICDLAFHRKIDN